MEERRYKPIATVMAIKDMEKCVDFYAIMFGDHAFDKLILKNGKLKYVSVGFDSPLIMLSQFECSRTSQARSILAKNNAGDGVTLYFGMNGPKKLGAFFSEVLEKGIRIISE